MIYLFATGECYVEKCQCDSSGSVCRSFAWRFAAWPGAVDVDRARRRPGRKELYGMKLVRADTAAREVWSNSNGYSVTAVWDVRGKHFDAASNKTVAVLQD